MGTKLHKSTANIFFDDKETMLWVLTSIRVLQTSCSMISYDVGSKLYTSTANILFDDKETMLLVLNSIQVQQTSCSMISYVQTHGA